MKKDAAITWPLRQFPRIRVAGVFPLPVSANHVRYISPTIALHLHDYEGRVTIRGKEIQLQPGDITISPPNQVSLYHLHRDGRHLCLHFDPAPASRSKGGFTLPFHLRLGARTASVRERIGRITDHFRRSGENPDSPSGVAAASALLELLLYLHVQTDSPAAAARSGLAENSLGPLVQAIEASLRQPITVPQLAAQSGWSADHISRLFRRHYAMTIPRFLLLRRMELARHLLQSSNLPIKEIAGRVGIPDPQYFNKQFRKIAGLSPSAYRLTQRKRNSNQPRRGR